MPEDWQRFQQTLALAAFVAGCTMAEMQMRLVAAALDPIGSIRPPRARRSAMTQSLIEEDR